MWIITREASALCLVLLVILNLSLFFDPVGTLHKVSLLVAQFWVGLIILAKMLFQLQTVPKDILVNNCTVYFNYTAVFHNHTVVLNNVSQIESVKDDFAWLGLRMLHHGTGEYKNSLPYYIGGYVLVLGGLTVLAMFKIHDFHMYKSDRLPVGVTFPNIKWQQIDSSFVKLMGYLINYAFIKFGLEICTVVSVVAVFYRQDAVGALYILLLGILLLLNICKRSYVRNVWFIYLVVLALMLPAQYISALGLPPTLCQEYPWLNMKNTLRLWLFLPDYFKPPDVQVLIADCIQFLFVALQWRVFRMENIANHPTITAAGDNEELGPRPPDHFKDMHDFLNTKRNSVDVIMSALFSYTFWLCICILFITGTQNINLYCFGYLIFCFYFFWYGLDFTIKDRKFVMKIWNALVYYNFIVILIKTWLQLPGCVYPEYFASGEDKVTNGVNKHCIAPELFSIKCLNKQFPVTKEKVVCDVSDKEAGLIWDIICFVVLLIQRRVFMSSYFLVVVCEEKAQAQLASRGAALINLISTKKIAKQQRNKQRELANISKKLEKIRLRTIRLEGGLSREGWTHFDVIRSADETMFDDFSDDETTTAESMDTVTDQLLNASDREKSNPMKMLVQAIDSGMDDSLKQAGKGKERAKKEPTSPTEADSADVTLDVTHDDGEPPIEEGPSTSAGPAVESAPEEEAHSSSTHDQLHKVAEQAKTTDAWIKKFVISCTKWIIYKLNDMSYDYRTVAKQIDEEQVAVKADLKDKMMNPEQTEEIQPEVRYEDINLEQFEVMWQEDLEKRSLVYRLLNAMYLALIARTEFICYFTMVLCQICNGSLLSLPLPIAAMLWGMLSLPRPAKRFWIVVLSYVMLVVVVKYIFQFGLWPWSSTALIKWNDPRLLFGIQEADPESCSTLGNQEDCQADKDKESHPYYAKYELLVLLSVFIHRSVLKRYGLWKNEIEQEEDFNNVARQSERSLELSGSLPTTDNVAEEGNNVDENDQQLVDSTEQKRSSGCPSILTWYRHIMNGKFFSQGDYYSLMVLCDFINFIISVAAYSSFGPPQYGNVQDYIQQNRVPVSFLIILLVQFALIVIDRALYLRKSVLGKLIFHVLLVIIIHIYMFFVLPAFTSTSFNRNTAAQLWYFIKCVYFGLSAWQIKSGYPSGVIGNFLTKSYGYVNLVLFKAFIICPFLLELRSVMDWMWTKTSMSLSDWFLMEDIFVKLFTLKCFRAGEKEYPVPRAQNRVALVKYGLGGFVLLALIFVIWFPLVIFSFANTIYLVNPPIQCQMTVSIGGFQTIFTVRSQPSEINNITSKELDKLKETFSTSPPATGFLDNFDVTDIRTIRMSGESTAIWGITEPSERALITALRSNDSLAATVTLAFTRRSKKGLTSGTISTEFTFDLEPQSDIRGQLLIQVQNKTEKTVVFPNFLPRYLHLPATGEPTPTSALHCHPCSRQKTGLGMISYHGLGLSLHKSAKGEYWSLIENNNCTQSFAPVCGSEHVESKDLFFVTFNERIAPDAVSFITGIGIIGLYIGMVFVIGQFVRTLTSGGSYTIMFDELPNVDRIMKICKDLYFVRENEQLALEEELFAKLIFLYRSPKMLIHSSKIKVA